VIIKLAEDLKSGDCIVIEGRKYVLLEDADDGTEELIDDGLVYIFARQKGSALNSSIVFNAGDEIVMEEA